MNAPCHAVTHINTTLPTLHLNCISRSTYPHHKIRTYIKLSPINTQHVSQSLGQIVSQPTLTHFNSHHAFLLPPYHAAPHGRHHLRWAGSSRSARLRYLPDWLFHRSRRMLRGRWPHFRHCSCGSRTTSGPGMQRRSRRVLCFLRRGGTGSDAVRKLSR